MNEPFTATGGARIGWMNASWPLAKLTATAHSLQVTVRLVGDYRFTPETVISITGHGIIPVLGWGIQIQHRIPEYPARIVFRCLGSPETLLAGIHAAGFQPQAPASALPLRTGQAFRWPPAIIALLVWNGLFLLDLSSGRRPLPIPGPFSTLALGLIFAASLATLRLPAFQRLILKPGRNVGEIRPILHLLLVISGCMAVIFLLS